MYLADFAGGRFSVGSTPYCERFEVAYPFKWVKGDLRFASGTYKFNSPKDLSRIRIASSTSVLPMFSIGVRRMTLL